MYPSVTLAWPAFCQQWEGVCYWMYLDTKDNVTTGTGNLIDTIVDAQALEWVNLDGSIATLQQISDEWLRVKAMTQYSRLDGLNRVWSSSATMLLTKPTVDKLLLTKTSTFWSRLQKTLPKLETYPADAQLALMDESWQNGPAFLDPGTVWVNTRAAVLSENWTNAALAVPGTGDRSTARKRLFNNAASVVKLGIDKSILWNTKIPVAPPVPPVPPTPPKPPEDKVMYSKKWKTEYVSFRGGYFAPITVSKLLAIPTTVRVVQGGLSFASASAQTHAGIGSGDLSVRGMTKDEVWKLCVELWQVNIVPCPRGFTKDSFQGKTVSNINDGNEHIHFLDRDSYKSMHSQAQAQVREVLAGGDGLVGSADYTGPSKSNLQSWKDSQYNPANIKKVKGTFYVVSKTLVGNNSYRVVKENKKLGDRIDYVSQIKRWGRWNAVTSKNVYFAISDSKQTYLSTKNPLIKPPTPPKPPVPPKPPTPPKPPVPPKPPKTGFSKVIELDAPGGGNWQGCVQNAKTKEWFVAHSSSRTDGKEDVILYRFDKAGKYKDKMTLPRCSHVYGFGVSDTNIIWLTWNDYTGNDVVTFQYRANKTISKKNTSRMHVFSDGKVDVSFSPNRAWMVLRQNDNPKGYETYALHFKNNVVSNKNKPSGKIIKIKTSPSRVVQGFSAGNDRVLYVLVGLSPKSAFRIEKWSFLTGKKVSEMKLPSNIGLSEVSVKSGKKTEPEGMDGNTFSIKAGEGNDRRMVVYKLNNF